MERKTAVFQSLHTLGLSREWPLPTPVPWKQQKFGVPGCLIPSCSSALEAPGGGIGRSVWGQAEGVALEEPWSKVCKGGWGSPWIP